MSTEIPAWDIILATLVKSGAIPGAVHRVLLWGPPRTGKSSLPGTLCPGRTERVTLHRQQPVDDLLGGYCLKDGTTVWADGPAVRAMRNGDVLVLDEIDQFSPETRCVLHALMDDPSGVTLASGERVNATAGYTVIATTNALPSTLPAAIYDRFDLVLKADTLSRGLKNQLGALANVAENCVGRDGAKYAWSRTASVNLYIATGKLRKFGMADEAIARIMGMSTREQCDFLATIAVKS